MKLSRAKLNKAFAAAAIGLTLGFPLYLISEILGPVPRSTGGDFPGESSCARSDCHGGDLNSGPGSVAVTIDGQPMDQYNYRPGTTVPVVVTVMEAGKIRWGFQATSRSDDGCLQAGSFAVSSDDSVQILTDAAFAAGCPSSTIEFPEHRFPKDGGNGASFEFSWTAPPAGFGPVRFAAAGNAANGDDENTGDNIYSVEARIEPEVAALPAPEISAGGVLLANLDPAIPAISPRAIATVFGEELSNQTVLEPDLDDAGNVATRLGGSCIEVGGERAPIFAILPTQANFQVPDTTSGAGESIEVTVIRNCDGDFEARSEPALVPSDEWLPAFFVFPQFEGEDGANPIATLHGGGPDVVAPEGLFEDTAEQRFFPAEEGEFVSLFMTGLGATDPAFAAGEIPGVAAEVTEPVEVSIGGIMLTPDDVFYVGVAPCCAGLYQAVVKIPEGIGPGNHEVRFRINDVETPPGPFVPVE